jgi:hypothetical protein
MRVSSEIMIIQTEIILSTNEYILMNDRSLSKISTTTSQIQIEKDVAKDLDNLIHSMNDKNSNELIDATIEWVIKCWVWIICDWWNKTSFMKLVNSIVTKHLHDKNKWENYARFFCHDLININFKSRIRIKDYSTDFYLYQVFEIFVMFEMKMFLEWSSDWTKPDVGVPTQPIAEVGHSTLFNELGWVDEFVRRSNPTHSRGAHPLFEKKEGVK